MIHPPMDIACTERVVGSDEIKSKSDHDEVSDMRIQQSELATGKSADQGTSKHSWKQFSKLPLSSDASFEMPKPGTPVSSSMIKRAGPYLLGPLIRISPVKSIVQYLARRIGTDKYYTIKILTLKDENELETEDDRQGKMLLHAEYSLLSLLQNQDGVIHHHGFFKDCALEEKSTASGMVYTGKVKRRLCLVLDCLTSHDFNPRNDELLNLQHHIVKERKLSEKETLLIFIDTVRIVAALHKRNIVHKDLKLGNLVLNCRTRRVTIINFFLGKHLSSENDLLKDQRGSPAYISPEVLSGKPYLGKPSDMWALGVVLFIMLYGQFPFYDSSPTQLFNKIKAANYDIPNDDRISEGTSSIIRNLLVLEPSNRLTAIEVLESLSAIIATFKVPTIIGEDEQVVPDISTFDEKSLDKKLGKKNEETKRDKPYSDFFKQISLQEHMQQMVKQQQSPVVSRRKLYSQVPVHRVDSEPRELTANEIDRFKHLFSRDSQRHNYNSSRREGYLLRVRGNSRNRNTPLNQGQSGSDQRAHQHDIQQSSNSYNSLINHGSSNDQSQNMANTDSAANINRASISTGSVNNMGRTNELHTANTSLPFSRSTRGLPNQRSRSESNRLFNSSTSSRHSVPNENDTQLSTSQQHAEMVETTSNSQQVRSVFPEGQENHIHSVEAQNRFSHTQNESRIYGSSQVNFTNSSSDRSQTTNNNSSSIGTFAERIRSITEARNSNLQNMITGAIVDRRRAIRAQRRENRNHDVIGREMINGLAYLVSSDSLNFILSLLRPGLERHGRVPYLTNSISNVRLAGSRNDSTNLANPAVAPVRFESLRNPMPNFETSTLNNTVSNGNVSLQNDMDLS
ncbi:probable serine/threonine-protein kinase DDB_G0277165 [Orussus abietinus]|uniref:probable serine/threonine-protein kinase DDB_G0277165 n=1 Tax=Orussus abietinus TaxID=222816 RepID=UPI0006260C61|nr:probable serine/threonine-protein kinase DDB_G0277165 [Orussus abietinus]XP_023289634.1 probable serine/threonine-protein kinase DDB_G0277165 [Orussus abietinus]XP_023289635.1 probable serine/threonine-protein kinase DDB_G0277165 [Orussus abietinus]XP_023289636.1 probable serine/threonine-protein kinase DDB_G0277165 [Orussus abietinus]XP_023289637.1 probable serine/threonine-protein kinase DDB_G0277165 [Orussus abietinus]XP_023289638.1 probable serine/threonine-protein kinase DDB_G0277165 [